MFISITIMPEATKLCNKATKGERLSPQKPHDHLNKYLHEVMWQIKSTKLQISPCLWPIAAQQLGGQGSKVRYDHHTCQGGHIPYGTPTHKVT